MNKTHLFSAMILLLAPLAGCDPAVVPVDAPATDSGNDTGGGFDGGRDAGRDAGGPADPCAAEPGAAAAATVGCNGPVGGPTREANAHGGACTEDSCTDAMSTCRADGYCDVACDPGTGYVSTSTCPSGSRCFPVGSGVGLCFIDCNTAADCPIPGSMCDAENSCIAPPPVGDAGVPDTDGGVIDTDAGVPDTDAGVPDTDAGTEGDGGVPDTDAGPPA